MFTVAYLFNTASFQSNQCDWGGVGGKGRILKIVCLFVCVCFSLLLVLSIYIYIEHFIHATQL